VPSASADARISIEEAFQQLMLAAHAKAHPARMWLNTALQAGQAPLWTGDHLVDPNVIATHLLVMAKPGPGGWHAEIKAIKAIRGLVPGPDVGGSYDWKTSARSITALIERQMEPKLAGGAPRKYDREQILIEAIAQLWEKRTLPSTFEKFWRDVGAALGDGNPGDTILKEVLIPLYQRLKTSC
jgi:hypothetical protein